MEDILYLWNERHNITDTLNFMHFYKFPAVPTESH